MKKEIKIGDIYEIHCYKHNGKIDRICDDAMILDITDDYIVCGNYRTNLTESNGKSHRTKETAIIFFYKKRWFNVLAQLKKYGLFYYCNIASPFIIDENIIKYIDYDLDLRVFSDGAFKILDRNEYNYHRKLMNYPKEINYIIKNELSSLIEMKKSSVFPFDKKIVEYYYGIFKEILKNR